MKKLLCILAALFLATAAFAQESGIPFRLELAEVEMDDDAVNLEVFNMPVDGQNHYYLSVGNLGVGDEVVQINFDPLFELFIPLGDTVAEAMDRLTELQELVKTSPGNYVEMPGCLAVGFPTDQLETVKVTSRRFLLTRLLAFSVERDGYLRATHIPRSAINSLVSSMNFYRRLHPNEP